jgi:flavin reductase (DIM6/NTAB) family NADH-FMN oxidoreductase RutF
MIERELKRSLGQLIQGVQVVGAAHDGVVRAYTSHWITQVSFDEPVLLASVSPKHDTHPLIVGSGRLTVSILAADQIAEGQWFSYPGRRFGRVLTEYLELVDGRPVVPGCVAWLGCEVIERISGRLDHDLFLVRVVETGPGRLREPPLLYSSRLGWRATGDKVRAAGGSVRDDLIRRSEERLGRQIDVPPD